MNGSRLALCELRNQKTNSTQSSAQISWAFADKNMAFDHAAWQSTFRSAMFWSRYFCVEHRLPDLRDDSAPPSDTIDLEIGVGPKLRIFLGAGVNLGIMGHRHVGDPIELGWEDGCHGHPHVFRWPECLVLSRYLADHVFNESFPGNALLLLALFSPITVRESRAAKPVLHAALNSNGIERVVADVIADSCVMPYSDFGWLRSADGRYECVGEGAASLRQCNNLAFPFAMIDELLADASATSP